MTEAPEDRAAQPDDGGAPDPTEVVPGYETDPSAVGTERQAAPPDGVDHDWTEVHPGAARVIEEEDGGT